MLFHHAKVPSTGFNFSLDSCSAYCDFVNIFRIRRHKTASEADWGCLLLVIIPRWGWDDKLQIRPRLVSTVLLLGNPSSTIIHGCKLAAETTLGTTTSTTALERKHPFLFIRPFIDIASSFIAPAVGNKTKEYLCMETRPWSTGRKSLQR